MITTPLKTFKLLSNLKTASHAIVLTSHMLSFVTNVKRNVLERQGRKNQTNRQSQSVSPTHSATTMPTIKSRRTLRVYGNAEFQIFPLLQMGSQDTNSRRNYDKRFLQKFKTKLNFNQKLTLEKFRRNLPL